MGGQEAIVDEQSDRMGAVALGKPEIGLVRGMGAVADDGRSRGGRGRPGAELLQEAVEVERHRVNDRRSP